MANLPPETLAEFERAFNLIDKNQDGAISPDELKTVMFEAGHQATDEEIQNMIKEADLDNSGNVDFPQFTKMMKKRMEQNKLLEAFQTFDKDGSGKVSAEELKQIIKNVGEEISDDELAEMIKEADKDGDGQVDYEEFIKMMSN